MKSEATRDIEDRLRPRARPEPFEGVDVTGMPADLATAETNALRRRSPRRNRWPELAEIDARVADLERRQSEAAERVRDLRERLTASPRADADALATWELEGRKGSRPGATRQELEAELAEAEPLVAGLDAAVGRVLAEKAAFVTRHRARLVKDAEKATDAAHERMVELVGELEQARENLTDLRQAILWAQLYPGELAGREPNRALLFGGLAQPTRETLGVEVVVQAAHVLRALRADADYWRDAATPEQRAQIDGPGRADLRRGAIHDDSPEGQEAIRLEKERQIADYEQHWGRRPPEW